MPEPTEGRVAVYIDFDNIVISRFDQLRRGTKVPSTRLSSYDPGAPDANLAVNTLLTSATVDVGAVLDFASSFGDIVISRAYADWSVPVNASYAQQLVARAVDLTQMFPTVQSKTKNGADIRLAVDVIEDLFRLPDLTHVFIIAGDSDYIALAQRSKRLGRYVVGIGVAGSSSASLAAACDEFFDYDELPGVKDADTPEVQELVREQAPAPAKKSTKAAELPADGAPRRGASGLLHRALLLMHSKDDADWLTLSAVKSQMLRMDPTFNEKAEGFSSFSAFVKSRASFANLDEESSVRKVQLRATKSK